jgi:hypothetical protein
MSAITDEEKAGDTKRSVIRTSTQEEIILTVAVEGTPASAHCRLHKVGSAEVVSRTFSSDEIAASGDRVDWSLPIDDAGIYALSASISAVPGNWEAMLKLSVDDDEVYRDYDIHQVTSAGQISRIGIALAVAIVVAEDVP